VSPIALFALTATLTAAALIGYMAQTTGICLVRGVKELGQGKPLRLLAILISGFWLCLYLPWVSLAGEGAVLVRHQLSWFHVLGGVVFGVGASLNSGCTISTLSRLSSGEIKMFFTLLGWLAGWGIWDSLGFSLLNLPMAPANPLLVWTPVVMMIVGTITLNVFFPEFRRLWNGVMLFGVLSGALFVLQPRWTPSSLIIDTARSIPGYDGVPSVTQLLIALMLLLGMFLGARVSETFALALPKLGDVFVHLGAGTMMGIGGYLSLGGNDIQLLQAVPVISPAGIGAIVCMMAGMWLGLRMMKR
jgi:hypothetical protein